jgi:alpha/beta superfamily hydrolase|tara:strand:+ start:245003 stop:245671 length:669 start_codon:yes stop_codon:yes gene_type:complete
MEMAEHKETKAFEGQAGPIDCVIEWPQAPIEGWALVLHPHPLYGGTRDNKVVTTLARACLQRNLVTLRPNFRGVGNSAGTFDHGKGETADMQMLVEQFMQAYPELAEKPWVLAGFSFGTAVAAQLQANLDDTIQDKSSVCGVPQILILVGTAVGRFQFRNIALSEGTLMIHGEVDEVVPFSEAMDFARQHEQPITVIPDASHFFHGKLVALKALVQQRLATL